MEQALSDGDLPRYKRSLIHARWNTSAIRELQDLSPPTSHGRDRCGLWIRWIANRVQPSRCIRRCFLQRLLAHRPPDNATMRGRLLAQAGRTKSPRAATDRRKRGMSLVYRRARSPQSGPGCWTCSSRPSLPTVEPRTQASLNRASSSTTRCRRGIRNFTGKSRMSMGMKRHG
jgi:hypothetical protein